MKYTLSGTCDCPRDFFVRCMFQPDEMMVWQKSLIGHEALTGKPGTTGSTARLSHRYGKRRIEMTETIEAASLPDSLTAVYEAPGAWNRVGFHFTDSPSGGTDWKMECEFRCTGMLRILTLFLPGMFRRTSQSEMNDLTAYAEASFKISEA